MGRYPPGLMRSFRLRLAGIAGAALLVTALGTSASAGTGTIAQEVMRSSQLEKRLVHIWWLPVEYWIDAARELRKSADDIDDVRKLFRNYLMIAILDAELKDDGSFEPATHSQIGPELEVRRNGDPIELLHRIDPRVARWTGELSYLLRTSLGPLGPGLRIFFLSNVDDGGRPLLQGGSRGTLEIRYTRAADASHPLRYRWHAPLTAVAGAHTCPEGGEPLDASWLYCPWHGVRVD